MPAGEGEDKQEDTPKKETQKLKSERGEEEEVKAWVGFFCLENPFRAGPLPADN